MFGEGKELSEKLKRTVDTISWGGGQQGLAQVWNSRFYSEHLKPLG